jgi:hypothetical protein
LQTVQNKSSSRFKPTNYQRQMTPTSRSYRKKCSIWRKYLIWRDLVEAPTTYTSNCCT